MFSLAIVIVISVIFVYHHINYSALSNLHLNLLNTLKLQAVDTY